MIIAKRIETYYEENNVLSECQFGFQSNRRPVDPLFILSSLLEKSNANQKSLASIERILLKEMEAT